MTFDSEDARAFSATVAQLVAVFGLALVIEVRRSAAGWMDGPRWLRWTKAAFYVAVAFILLLNLSLSLAGTANPTLSSASFYFTLFSMSIAFSVLVYNPISDLFSAGSTDLFLELAALLPFSKRSRALRRTWALTRAILDVAEGALDDYEVLVNEARELAALARAQRKGRNSLLEARAGLIFFAPYTPIDLPKLKAEVADALMDNWRSKAAIGRGGRRLARAMARSDDLFVMISENLVEAEQLLHSLRPMHRYDERSSLIDDRLKQLTALEQSARSRRQGQSPPTVSKPS